MPSLGRRIAAEFVRTAFLLAAIVGSGIMAETLSTDPGLQLLQNALATAGALTAMILALGPVSGVPLNPAVTLADRAFGGLTLRETIGYISEQSSGGIAGVIVANLTFDLPAATWSNTARSGSHLWLAGRDRGLFHDHQASAAVLVARASEECGAITSDRAPPPSAGRGPWSIPQGSRGRWRHRCSRRAPWRTPRRRQRCRPRSR